MKKKIFLTAGALGLFLIGSLLQSRGSRAAGVYSTPVTVMNTTASPAITLDVEQAARAPYESSMTQICGGPVQCVFSFGGGPLPGHRLVIENVSGQMSLAPGTTALPNIQFGTGNNGANGGNFGNFWGIPPGPIVPVFNSGALEATFNQKVLAYVDSGGSAVVSMYSNFSGFSTVTLSGYVQDCSILACPTIQHF